MKLAVAARNGSAHSTELLRAERLTIYTREKQRFLVLEQRPLKALADPRDLNAWLELLQGCSGLLARAVPPRLAFGFQQHGIVTLGDAGFGAGELSEALEFLQALARNHAFIDGDGI